MASITNFLDLYDVLVNEVAGDVYLFIFLSMAMIAIWGAYSRLTNEAIIMIEVAFLLIMSPFFPFLLPITLLLSGVFIAWHFYKIIKG